MFLSLVTLLVALGLSVIAAYYSIAGLAAIFAAAVVPIIIMGSVLEAAKIVATLWLHEYWRQARFLMKLYLVPAVVMLMLITSMGIFGFLSKAHSDQTLSTGDIGANISLYDEQIKVERDNIENARALIAQLDGVVNALTTGQDRTGRRADGSEFTISSAERALTTRRSQQKDRDALTKKIEEAQNRILEFQKKKAPIAAEQRKVEAEVGPIKYIAALIYGDNPDTNVLERAVRWVIILLVCVFDPLAIMMLLAATESLSWTRQKKQALLNSLAPATEAAPKSEIYVDEPPNFDDEEIEEPNLDHGTCHKCGTALELAPGIGPFCPNRNCDVADGPFFDEPQPHRPETHPYLRKGFAGFPNHIKPIVAPTSKYEPDNGLLTDEQIKQIAETAEVPTTIKKVTSTILDVPEEEKPHDEEIVNVRLAEPEEIEPAVPEVSAPAEDELVDDDDSEFDGMDVNEKAAARRWKAVHPNQTLKFQRRLVDLGKILQVPWMSPEYYYKLSPDADMGNETNSGFGIAFPPNPKKGDSFLRVDRLPSLLFKYNGKIWIEVDKALNDRYAHDQAYIDHLIAKIDSGEYDPDLLSDAERIQIEQRLTGK